MDEATCNERFPNDPRVEALEVLLRRIPPWHFIRDENIGGLRPSSAAFDDDGDGHPMSVYLSGVMQNENRPSASVLHGNEGFALAGILAGLARDNRQSIHPDGDGDSAHAVVCGPKSQSTRRRFARQSHWVVPPPE